ncbi:YciI family protein [Massilia sp. PAMC28688]|uniref:YciI family protein n=1 Tax=Massilia sp. PAMC28688 TaxID=2861283 RepID=UPI001C63487A|nr:YciI family protein [Massilia sp. PAMC28688]QYF94997.1 YciI family protein [Massilia sp. PAMC28688]
MFLILLNYKKPLSEVDRFVAEHREFLAEQYAAGVFKLSGRREPRTGGVILARAASLPEIEAVISRDPFHREQIADYEIVEFCPTMSSADLAHLTEA